MFEPNNGQRAKPKRHNAKRCPLAIQQRIVNSLAIGDSLRSIAFDWQMANAIRPDVIGDSCTGLRSADYA
jgi:hypothetical protein